jgi:molybdopterin molybdotransferase
MISVEQALELVLDPIAPLDSERVPLAQAAGRVAAEPARAAVDLPPFDRSAMDGYAVRAADAAAGPLVLAGAVAAGDVATTELAPGTAMGITTGAALPPGADAILQSEHATVLDGHVSADPAPPAGRHVRYRGEDVHRGDVLVPAGKRIGIAHVSSLVAAGVAAVEVRRRARVAILVTGSELLEPGAPPEPGRIHDSNGVVLRLLTERAGAQAIPLGRAPDERPETVAAIERGLGADVLLISGGVSVGEHDHVKPALAELGVEELFWRVRLKPGKPLWFGRRGETLVFGLPGNPLSSLVCFLVFVAPALDRLHGETEARPTYVRGRLAVPAEAEDGRTTFLTARLERAEDGTLLATPTERQGSHMTGALGESDGFVVVPHDPGDLSAGAAVDILVSP